MLLGHGRTTPLQNVSHGPAKLPFESVVQIFTVACEPSYLLPWQVSPQISSSGSGFAIELRGKKFVLTNAHVACSTISAVLRAQKHGSAEKYHATAICIGFDCDLALLQVIRTSIFEASLSPSFQSIMCTS